MKKKLTMVLGGGTGVPATLSGYRENKELEIIAVATTVDSGGSTRRLRDETGMLPPSDVFRCILGLSPYNDDPAIRELLLHRINGICKELDGHTFSNLVLTSATKYSSYLDAVRAISQWLKIKGTVLPITLSDVHLIGITKSGNVYPDEASIGTRDDCEPFEKLFLSPRAEPLPAVLEAIERAAAIIFGPGDLITSQFPHLLVDGVSPAIVRSRAKKIHVINMMTRFAETHNFRVSDHTRFLEERLGCKFDYVVCNGTPVPAPMKDRYAKEKAYPVEVDVSGDWGGRQVISASLLVEGDLARHDPKRLAAVVGSIILS